MHFTQKMIDDSAKKLKIDISKYNMDQVKAGIQVELEHGSKAGKLLDVTHDDLTKTLQIALAHLEEDPEYYTKLAIMEHGEENPKKVETGRIDTLESQVRSVVEKNEHRSSADLLLGEYIDQIIAYPSLLTRFLEFIQTLPAKYRSYFHIYDLDFTNSEFFKNQTTNIWNLIPDSYKKITDIKQLSFEPNPEDPNLKKIVEPFIGTNELRLMMQGVHFDEHGIVATNAHILIFIKRLAKQRGTYCMTKNCWEHSGREDALEKKGEKYPNYPYVIPDNHNFFPIHLDALREYCKVLSKAKLLNQTAQQGIFKLREDFFGFNIHLLLEAVESFMKLGYVYAEISFSSPNRAVVITPIHRHADAKELKTDFILVMPLMLSGYSYDQRGDLFFDMESQCVRQVGFEPVCLHLEIRSKNEILESAKLVKGHHKQKSREISEQAAAEEKELRSQIETEQEEQHLGETHGGHDELSLAQAQELELLELEMNLGDKKKKSSSPKGKEILKELLSPNIGANPGGRWGAAIREGGWLGDHQYFDSPEAAIKWLNDHNKKATHVILGDPFRTVPANKKNGFITPKGKQAEEFLSKKDLKKEKLSGYKIGDILRSKLNILKENRLSDSYQTGERIKLESIYDEAHVGEVKKWYVLNMDYTGDKINLEHSILSEEYLSENFESDVKKKKDNKIEYPVDIKAIHDSIMKSGVTREQAESLLAYTGSEDELKKLVHGKGTFMTGKMPIARLQKIPGIGKKTAEKVIKYYKKK